MNPYRETDWDRYLEDQIYTRSQEVLDVVNRMCDPANVNCFSTIICEAYLNECESAISFFEKNRLDISNAYAYLNYYRSFGELMLKQVESDREREF